MLPIIFLAVAFLAGVILLKGIGTNDLKPVKIRERAEDSGNDNLLIAKRDSGSMPEDWIGIARGRKGAERLSGVSGEDMADRGALGLPRPDPSEIDQTEGCAEAADRQDEPGDGILNGGTGGDELIGEGGADQPDMNASEVQSDLLNGEAVNPEDLTEFDLSVDTLIFVKDPGAPDPMLRLTINRNRTQTLTADDEVVAVINDTDMCVSDIIIVERGEIGIKG